MGGAVNDIIEGVMSPVEDILELGGDIVGGAIKETKSVLTTPERHKARRKRAAAEVAAADQRAQAKIQEAADRKQLESEREDAASQRARKRRRQRLASKGEGRRSTIITDALGTTGSEGESGKTLLGI